MQDDERLRRAFVSVEVNDSFTEAVILLSDQSKLCVCHRVGERWVKAAGPGLAEQVLAGIATFRLNGKHLELAFADSSRWELRFQ